DLRARRTAGLPGGHPRGSRKMRRGTQAKPSRVCPLEFWMRLEPPGKGRHSTRTPPRTIWITGRVTSIRLEPAFWQWLREIAMECGLTTKALIEGIVVDKNPHWPLTSALRHYIAEYFRNRDLGPHVVLVDQLRGTRRAHRTQEAARSRRMAARAQARS